MQNDMPFYEAVAMPMTVTFDGLKFTNKKCFYQNLVYSFHLSLCFACVFVFVGQRPLFNDELRASNEKSETNKNCICDVAAAHTFVIVMIRQRFGHDVAATLQNIRIIRIAFPSQIYLNPAVWQCPTTETHSNSHSHKVNETKYRPICIALMCLICMCCGGASQRQQRNFIYSNRNQSETSESLLLLLHDCAMFM